MVASQLSLPVVVRRSRVKGWILHGIRLAMLAVALGLVHHRQAEWRATRLLATASAASAPPLEKVRQIFAAAHALEPAEEQWTVFDAGGRILGTVLQTSPVSDSIIGFSGSTNVLIGLGTDGRIAGATILSSGDTGEHVEQVRGDPEFFSALVGKHPRQSQEIAAIDGVSGATLTSVAILQSVLKRLGDGAASLKFPTLPTADDVRSWWPTAAHVVAPEQPDGLWRVENVHRQVLGWLLRTSPTTDDLVGYQGPTDTIVGLDSSQRVLGIALLDTYDNAPYVDWVAEDRAFVRWFQGKSLAELAAMDLEEAGIEGVSGATMTSMVVVAGIPLAARRAVAAQRQASGKTVEQALRRAVRRDWPILLVVLLGCWLGFSHARGIRLLRLIFQATVVVVLGWMHGAMVSQAQLFGWASHGVPWWNAFGLVALTCAALLLPVSTGRNVYCSHLCPHGVVQQWLRPRRRALHLSPRIRQGLKTLPGVILAWCLVVMLVPLPYSLVAIEPFDAWVFRIAGWGTIAVAVIGLLVSCRLPMAYCRFGCPTGAMLEFLRWNSRADQWGPRDWAALLLLLVGGTIVLWVH
ncbi:MAG: NosR regulatory protein [Pirellulaceae bacterium]|nr:MAG: NosR regulatory protein [Pirellulaceae bacterium]